jgi:hypothetical protein
MGSDITDAVRIAQDYLEAQTNPLYQAKMNAANAAMIPLTIYDDAEKAFGPKWPNLKLDRRISQYGPTLYKITNGEDAADVVKRIKASNDSSVKHAELNSIMRVGGGDGGYVPDEIMVGFYRPQDVVTTKPVRFANECEARQELNRQIKQGGTVRPCYTKYAPVMAHWEGGKHVIVPAKPDANEEAVYLKSKGVEPSLIKQIQPEILHMDLRLSTAYCTTASSDDTPLPGRSLEDAGW